MEACEKFSDESVERWIQDLRWAGDDEKVHSLLQNVVHQRRRLSAIQIKFWKRVVELYWRSGWSTPEIAAQFGVGKERVRAVVKALRREAQRYFGQDGQSQSVRTEAAPLQPEEPSSVHAESWGAFFEGDTFAKKPRFQRLVKTTSPRKQIGTKTVEIDGRTYQVRIFESGRPDGCFRFWANPRVKQAGPNREYDPDETKSILAHIPTAKDVEAAIDGDVEAREFLTQYNQVRDSKSNPLRVAEEIPKTTWQPAQSSPTRLVGQKEECVRCKRKSMTVLIDMDRAIHQRCESKSCAYMMVWRSSQKNRSKSVATTQFFVEQPAKESYALTRNEVIRFVRDNELVKQDLAAIAKVPAARLSDYLHDKPVSEEYANRIENAVANILFVWATFAPIKIALDDADAFWKAVELANKTHEAQSAWEGMEAGLRMKQEHNEAAAAD